MFHIYRYLITLLFFSINIRAQNFNLDSLKGRLTKTSNKIDALKIKYAIANGTKYTLPDTATNYINDCINEAKIIKFDSILGDAYKLKGILFDEQHLSDASINAYFESIKYYEKLNDVLGSAKSSANLGIIYRKIKNYKQAISFFHKSNSVFTSKDFFKGNLIVYQNLIICYTETKLNDSVEFYAEKCLNLANKMGYEDPFTYGNCAIVLLDKNPKLAEYYLQKTIALIGQDDTRGNKDVALWKSNLATLKLQNGNTTLALNLANEALSAYVNDIYCKESFSIHLLLKEIYKTNNNYKLALYHDEMALKISDTIYSASTSSAMQELYEKYNAEKKEIEIKNLTQLNNEKTTASKRKNIFLIILAFILIIVAVLLVVVFKNFKVKNEQSKQLQYQNKLIEQKQKEILDSIRYAKRIQQALLPNQKYISKFLKK